MVLVKAISTNISSCVIHEDTKVILASAFANCTSLTNITIPESLTHIGEAAFLSTGLTNIKIPESVKIISYGAFMGCRKLRSISFGGTINQWNTISLGSDWNCDISATEVICSDGVVKLK